MRRYLNVILISISMCTLLSMFPGSPPLQPNEIEITWTQVFEEQFHSIWLSQCLYYHFKIFYCWLYFKLRIHYFFVCSYSPGTGGTRSREFFKHLHFGLVSVFSELQLAEWRSQSFWYIILLIASLWFLRLYLHYLGQWLFLQAISIPVTKWVLSPESQRDTFSSWSAKWKCKTPLGAFSTRPKMQVWLEKTRNVFI